MAAASYYSQVPHEQQSNNVLYDSEFAFKPQGHAKHESTSSLKPLTLAGPEYSSGASWYDDHQQLGKADTRLKKRIRTVRVIQRVVATLAAIAAFIPITITLHKFLTTKDVIRSAPDGKGGTIDRGPWALQTKPWPTYMYFGTALFSTITHLGVLGGYMCSVAAANSIDTFGTWVQTIELVLQLVVWGVVTGIYKYEREVTDANGKHDDLWGWSCSGPAQAIQEAFKDVVPFNTYCNIQSASWYAGLVQVGAILLSLVVWGLAWRRRKSKQKIRRSAQRTLEGREDYRHM